MTWLTYTPLRAALLLGVMALGMLGVVHAGPQSQTMPLIPASLHGTLTIAGSPAAAGTVVCGRIDGVDKGCITTTEDSLYGGPAGPDSKLAIRGEPTDIGKTIEFFVTPPGTVGGLAAETAVFDPGESEELNLSLATTPAPVATPTPTPVALAVLSGLDVFPLVITVSGSVTITVEIASTGTALLSTAVTITVGNQTETFTVSLAPGTSQTLTATFTIATPGSYVVTVSEASVASLTGALDVVPAEEVSDTQELAITTVVVVTEEQVAVITTVLNAALGIELETDEAIEVVATTTELVAIAPRSIETSIQVTGLQASAEIVGVVDITIGNITIETTDGVGTGEIVLAEGLTIVGDVTLVAEDGVLDIVFEDTRLLVEPEAPPALLGGSEAVTHIDVTFDVGLENLPEGASLEVAFAKTADAFISDAGAIFQLAAEQVLGRGRGVVADAVEDIAFVVQVTRVGIENIDLGDNTITMKISRAWYEARRVQGKAVVITKLADDEPVTAATADCGVIGDIATCQVTFTGDAGGFSVFAVIAVAQTPVATATPTARPTATPVPPGVTVTSTPTAAATATPTGAPSTGEGDNFVLISGIVLAVVFAGGAGAYVVLRRRRRSV